MLRIHKRTMGHPSRQSRTHLGIVALDQGDLGRRLLVLEEPLVVRVGLDRERLTRPVGVDETHRDKVPLGDGLGAGHAQGVPQDCLDWAPDLYNVLVLY